MRVSLCIRQESKRMMIQSVWKNLTGLQKENDIQISVEELDWSAEKRNDDSVSGRTWLVCRKAAEHLWCDFNETQTHHQHQWLVHDGVPSLSYTSKTVAAEVEIQCLSTWIMFLSLLAQLGSAVSLLKKGCQYVCLYNECKVIGVWWWVLAHLKVTPEVFSWD